MFQQWLLAEEHRWQVRIGRQIAPPALPSVKTYRLVPIDVMLACAAGGKAPDTTPAASCDQLPTAGSKTRRSLRGPARSIAAR
jgi:hypothetical protein